MFWKNVFSNVNIISFTKYWNFFPYYQYQKIVKKLVHN